MTALSTVPALTGHTAGLVVAPGFPLPLMIDGDHLTAMGKAMRTGTCRCQGEIMTIVVPVEHPDDGPQRPLVRTCCISCGTLYPTPATDTAEKVAA